MATSSPISWTRTGVCMGSVLGRKGSVDRVMRSEIADTNWGLAASLRKAGALCLRDSALPRHLRASSGGRALIGGRRPEDTLLAAYRGNGGLAAVNLQDCQARKRQVP